MPGQRRLGAVLLAGAIVVGCGQSGDDFVPPPKATVVVTDGAYLPPRVEVRAGDRVTFVNRSQRINTAESLGAGESNRFDDTGVKLLSASQLKELGRFDTHVLNRGEAESVRFDTPGIYPFDSSLNEAMRGAVEVMPRRGDKQRP